MLAQFAARGLGGKYYYSLFLGSVAADDSPALASQDRRRKTDLLNACPVPASHPPGKTPRPIEPRYGGCRNARPGPWWPLARCRIREPKESRDALRVPRLGNRPTKIPASDEAGNHCCSIGTSRWFCPLGANREPLALPTLSQKRTSKPSYHRCDGRIYRAVPALRRSIRSC